MERLSLKVSMNSLTTPRAFRLLNAVENSHHRTHLLRQMAELGAKLLSGVTVDLAEVKEELAPLLFLQPPQDSGAARPAPPPAAQVATLPATQANPAMPAPIAVEQPASVDSTASSAPGSSESGGELDIDKLNSAMSKYFGGS